MKYSIQVNSLSKYFGKFAALKNISFNLPHKGFFGLLGSNGAGKTTLIGILLGLVKPTFGEVRILEHNIENEKNFFLNKINFESPYVDLPKKLTVKQNLIFYSKLYGVKNPKDKISYLCKALKIENLLDKKFGSLSSGQKTKVGICKSLVNEPKLLLLDEPTASLDPDTSLFVRKFLIRYQQNNNMCILIASHNMMEVEEICQSVIILNKGEILMRGSPLELVKTNNCKNLEELFIEIGK